MKNKDREKKLIERSVREIQSLIEVFKSNRGKIEETVCLRTLRGVISNQVMTTYLRENIQILFAEIVKYQRVYNYLIFENLAKENYSRIQVPSDTVLFWVRDNMNCLSFRWKIIGNIRSSFPNNDEGFYFWTSIDNIIKKRSTFSIYSPSSARRFFLRNSDMYESFEYYYIKFSEILRVEFSSYSTQEAVIEIKDRGDMTVIVDKEKRLLWRRL